MIIEQVPGKSLKIQTADGSVFVCETEVEKITKEAVSTSRDRPGTTGVQRGYRGFFDLGYTIGTGDYDDASRLELSTTHGYQFNPHFFLGAGVGVTYWHDMDYVGLPIFVDVRADILKYWVSPFIDFKIGYSFIDIEGVYFAPTVGCRFDVGGKASLNLGIGYTVQMCEVITGSRYVIRTSTENLGGFHLKFGVNF